MAWRRMQPEDLERVEGIAEVVHPLYPESAEVPVERLHLFPEGCLIAQDATGAPLGYLVSHPWRLGQAPALDSLLGALPGRPDCLYLHDIAVLPHARGRGLGEAAVAELAALALRLGLPALALVAVHGTEPYWTRQGFRRFEGDAALAEKLASYGPGCAYLTKPLP